MLSDVDELPHLLWKQTTSLLHLVPRALSRKRLQEVGSLLRDTDATPLVSVKLLQLEPADSVHVGGSGEEDDSSYS